MKPPLEKICLALAALALLAGGPGASAQSNGVPGPDNYTAFSHFITDRNIFDPSRQPHSYSPNSRYRSRPRPRPAGAPGIQLVGTMSYEKGPFAFFFGNDVGLNNALRTGDKLADYTVTEITPNSVRLEAADKKTELELKIGDGLRQENGKWVYAEAGELPVMSTRTETSRRYRGDGASSNEDTSSAPAAPAASPSTGEPNEILKRLMQLREQQNQ